MSGVKLEVEYRISGNEYRISSASAVVAKEAILQKRLPAPFKIMGSGLIRNISVAGLPNSPILPVDRLTAVFNDATNAYKFFWFRAILSLLKEGGDGHLRRRDLLWRMIEGVWYPLDHYKLSFGTQDSFVRLAVQLRQMVAIDNAPGSASLQQQVEGALSKKQLQTFFNTLSATLYRYVPYRFLRPFFDERVKKDVAVEEMIRRRSAEAARTDPFLCPYHFTDEGIQLHDPWKDYFLQHLALLEGFTHWNLMCYLERRNPNVPGIAQKLFKPEVRHLAPLRKAWTGYFDRGGARRCFFSGAPLGSDFALDHYVPWSYVVHDLNWNLAPVAGPVNASKSDRLPTAGWLDGFAQLQYDFFHTMKEAPESKVVLEDYALLFGDNVKAVAQRNEDGFKKRVRETLAPMLQIARNSGFTDWLEHPRATL
jgi:hypothetical protein